MLALIAERASGVPFHELVRQRVCEPAGMADTAFLRSDELPGRTALGYVEMDGVSRTNVFHSAGAGDRRRRHLHDGGRRRRVLARPLCGRIVPPDWVREMVRPRSDVPPKWRYGLGFWLPAPGRGDQLVGSDAGVSFRSVHDPGRTPDVHRALEHDRRRVADRPLPRRTVLKARG